MLARLTRWSIDLVGRFRRNERGVAAVEFALILPFLLTLYLGSVEASSLFTVDRRIEVIATTTADLIARWNPQEGAIPTSTVADYFKAAENIITPYSTVGLTQVVSFLQVSATGVATVVWSCGYNGGTARGKDTTFALSTSMKDMSKNGYLIAAETAYAYKPVLGMVFTSAINLGSEALFLPRFAKTLPAPTSGCPA